MEREAFGERLRRLREMRGLSVREFARRVGTNHSNIVLLEQGRRWRDGTQAERRDLLAGLGLAIVWREDGLHIAYAPDLAPFLPPTVAAVRPARAFTPPGGVAS